MNMQWYELDKKGRAREFLENNLLLYYLAWLSEKKLDELLPKVSYLDISSDIATHAFNNLLNKKI